jgi:hypothetical protein
VIGFTGNALPRRTSFRKVVFLLSPDNAFIRHVDYSELPVMRVYPREYCQSGLSLLCIAG